MSAPTAAQVRSYLATRPTRLARLSPEAQTTVLHGRGNLPAEAVKEFNRGRKVEHRYVRGNSAKAAAAAKAEATALRAAARKAGHKADRGPIPKSVLASLSKD